MKMIIKIYTQEILTLPHKKFPLKDKNFHSAGLFFEYYVNGEVDKKIGKTINGVLQTCDMLYGSDYCHDWYGY